MSAPVESRDRAIVALYDWMAQELLVVRAEFAEMAASVDRPTCELVRGILAGVAQHISATRGSGTVSALALLRQETDEEGRPGGAI